MTRKSVAPGLAELEHVADGGHGLLGRLAHGVGAAAAGEPGHRVGVPRRDTARDMTSEKSSSASALSLTSAHGLPSTSCGLLLEAGPLAVALEASARSRRREARRAVAEPPLDLPDRGGVDVLVVARDGPDVEDDRERVDPLAQRVPRRAELAGVR